MMRFSPKFLFRTTGFLVASSPKGQTACIHPRLGVYEFSQRQHSQHASTMKAVRVEEFGDESKLKVVTDSIPQPKDNEVLMKVEAIGVNPVEVMIRLGMFGDMIKTPYTPGTDASGTVEKVGPKVTKFKKGDRVYTIKATSGAYAEYCTTPEEYTSLLNNSLTFSQGAAIGLPYTVAHKALFIRAQAVKGETVLIHGASGAVGLAAVQTAKAKGMTVIGTAGTKEGMELVHSLGADFVANHTEEGYMDKIKKAAGSNGVNVILEMLANKNLVSDLQVLAFRGRIVVIGNKGSIPDFNPSLLMGVEADVKGLVVQTSTPEEYHQMLTAINQGQESWINPPISKAYSLSDVAEAHKDAAKGSDSKGKLVIVPSLD